MLKHRLMSVAVEFWYSKFRPGSREPEVQLYGR